MKTVTHITTRDAWNAAQRAGEYRHPSLDKQGFIHFFEPTPEQLLSVANALFLGQPGLVLLVVDPSRLAAPLRYEEYEPGSLHFPHLYGPLNLDAVTEVLDFVPGEDGRFSLPERWR
ncbi:DUF952 domain-containing protein [Deinococcus sp. VB343]|uniref:DUF952 domain-containing protein n=1 Tax=Deinococcus sp. VB343 TaxID=3385567 RepID=UPI0039C9EEF9